MELKLNTADIEHAGQQMRAKAAEMEEAIQNTILTSVGAATGEIITFLVSATARAIEVNNAKLYFELIGSKKSKSRKPKSNE